MSRNIIAGLRRLIPFLALTLGACSGGFGPFGSSDNQAASIDTTQNIYPAKYKEELLTILRARVEDLKFADAMVSKPALKSFGTVERYAVCLRIKNKPDTLAVFYNGVFGQITDASTEQCATAMYEPITSPK